MNIYDDIKEKVNDWYDQHPEGIDSFVDNTIRESNNEICQKLNDFVDYLELYGLKNRFLKAYIDAKYYLKEKAIENTDVLPDDNDDKAESAFYNWLRICINPRQDVNYDFYFEKNNMNRETEVSGILFDGDGKLREIFNSRDWQIRLKTISDWYLRRYNGTMSQKILKPFDCWEKFKLFYPRLLVAIIIGLLALITGQEGWDLPHKLADRIGYFGLTGVSIGFLAISIIYLNYECYNIILDKKKSFLRALRVGLYGFGASLIFSTIICITIGPISGTKEVIAPDTYYSLQAGLPVFKNIFFFASVALFVGIFIQVFWEKETITEPL